MGGVRKGRVLFGMHFSQSKNARLLNSEVISEDLLDGFSIKRVHIRRYVACIGKSTLDRAIYQLFLVRGVESLGNSDSTAQVHPHKLSNAMLDVAKEKGAKVVKGTVQNVVYEEAEDHQVHSIGLCINNFNHSEIQ